MYICVHNYTRNDMCVCVSIHKYTKKRICTHVFVYKQPAAGIYIHITHFPGKKIAQARGGPSTSYHIHHVVYIHIIPTSFDLHTHKIHT